jgi:2-methylisocitrate lyase-like PEP mutase family enzyme
VDELRFNQPHPFAMPEFSVPTSFRQIIDKAVKEKRFLVVPGAHDALSARIIQKLGFETYFIGGFPAVGARYGVPDVGLKGFGEISACVRDIMAACDLPVFVDGDDGYGDVKNVVHTVQSYERMGVSAILIEDQQWPKRCGHMAGKKVVPTEIAEAKIRAACSERLNKETWILARTDAVRSTISTRRWRAERYIRAGADGIFIEAPRSIDG